VQPALGADAAGGAGTCALSARSLPVGALAASARIALFWRACCERVRVCGALTRGAEQALHEDTLNTLNTIYMHICLVCVVNCRVSLDIKMRVMANGTTGCTTCHNIGTVVRICTLGRIVRVRDSAFYFCSCCMRVHAWTASGCEFQPCERAQRPRGAVAPPGRSCYFCARTNNIEAVSVLDDEHGVMQELSLCGRHMPFEQRMKYVENLDQLRQAVRDKLNRVHV